VTIALSGGDTQVKMTCKGCGRLFTGDADALKRQLGGGSRGEAAPALGGGAREDVGVQALEPVPTGDLPDIPELPPDRSFPALLEACTAQVYRRNAFRVMGLGVEATAREVAKQGEKLKMAARLGAGAGAGPGEEELREASQKLQDPERRLVEEIFWVWPLESGSPDPGLEAAARGEWGLAEVHWRGSGSGPALHNLAVSWHRQALELELAADEGRALTTEERAERAAYWKEALSHWQRALETEGFWQRLESRIQALDDPRLDHASITRIRASLPMALLGIEARLAVEAAEQGRLPAARAQAEALEGSGFGAEAVRDALRRALRPVRERVRQLAEAAEAEGDRDPPQAHKVAERLLKDTAGHLKVLQALAHPGDPILDGARDEIALKALACLIAFGNRTEGWAESLRVMETVLPIAVGDSARGRIERNLQVVRNNHSLGVCWWCGVNKGEDAKAVKKSFHRDVQRIPTGYNQVRITWRQSEISVPRCGECASRHLSTGIAGGVAGTAVGLLVLAGSCTGVQVSASREQKAWDEAQARHLKALQNPVWTAGNTRNVTEPPPQGPRPKTEPGCGCFLLLLLAIALGCGAGWGLMTWLLKGLKDTGWADKHPAVLQKRQEGWSEGAQPATQ
jgi:hypothetical protein